MRKALPILLFLSLLMFPMKIQAQNPDQGNVGVENPEAVENAPDARVEDILVAVGTVNVHPAVPETPKEVGEDVIDAVDYFATGSWAAGILILLGISFFFVRKYLAKKKVQP